MIEFNIFYLDYTKNLIEKYQRLSKLPGFVLLESSDKINGRYDILSAYPYEQLSLRQDESPSSFFEALQQLIPQSASPIDLPFQGGAIGYFSYDLAAALAGLQNKLQPTLEGLPLAQLGLYDWALISDHHLKRVSLFAANRRAETAGIVAEVLALWQDSCNGKANGFCLKESFHPLITQENYREAFQAIYRDLQRGRSYQVNYTQAFKAAFEGEPWAIYKQVRAKNPVPFSAFLRTKDAAILSFSPERFLLREQDYLLTSPIKGTARRAVEPQQDERLRQGLLASEKNRAENIMIVDLLRNDLGKIAKPGTVDVRELCMVESYPAIHHLVSHIEARCQANFSSWEVFRACFPGGSITGAPKLEAMHIIAEREAYARGVYCGAIGYFSQHGRFDTNIAIRTLTARHEFLHLAAGGGIVIDSNWEDEYLECFTKIAAIINGLN